MNFYTHVQISTCGGTITYVKVGDIDVKINEVVFKAIIIALFFIGAISLILGAVYYVVKHFSLMRLLRRSGHFRNAVYLLL